MKFKQPFVISMAMLLMCGCANKITYETTIAQLSEDATTNKQAYSLIHDSIEKLNELDSYTYTLSGLSYNPTNEDPFLIEQAKYKIKNEEGGYSGVALIQSYRTDTTLEDSIDQSINTYSFENSDTNQKMTDELSNGYACQVDCTMTIDANNPSHRYLLSPKEDLFETLLGEKVGFFKNISIAEYEESTMLKETYKTKKNYLQSFIDEKLDTWQDTGIYMNEGKTIITYTVNIELGKDYLENVLSYINDEEDEACLSKQINGEIPFVQTIKRDDTIIIDENGYLSSREQNYTITYSDGKQATYQTIDEVDISKVYTFGFSYSETTLNEYSELLSGTYVYRKADGSERTLIFSNTSVTIEEDNMVQVGSYTLKDYVLKITILGNDGTVLGKEKYQLSSDYQYLIDSDNNYYEYYSPPVEEPEEEEKEIYNEQYEEIPSIDEDVEEDTEVDTEVDTEESLETEEMTGEE